MFPAQAGIAKANTVIYRKRGRSSRSYAIPACAGNIIKKPFLLTETAFNYISIRSYSTFNVTRLKAVTVRSLFCCCRY